MDHAEFFETIIPLLRSQIKEFTVPVVTEMSERGWNPFHVLISTIISLRTKDDVTFHASTRLFKKAGDPEKMLNLSKEQIESLIYPAGFYKRKAATILEICQRLVNEYHGNVPDDLDELLSFKGVGRKTANLVISMGFKKPAICVDTHVHRISNRMGVINTKTPDETEFVLRDILPVKFWRMYNDILVAYGQNICRPISPFCSKCSITHMCEKRDVKKSR